MSLLAQAVRMEYPETIPVAVGMLPAAWMKYGSELQKLVDQYPQFFHGLKVERPAVFALGILGAEMDLEEDVLSNVL